MTQPTNKPVTSEAMQFGGRYTGDATDILDWLEMGGNWAAGDDEGGSGTLYIARPEGDMVVKPGDWIVKGADGAFYLCKPEFAKATGQTSDGYHTFDELYAHRVGLFAALMRCNPLSSWWSRKHHDGAGYDGWVIAGIQTPDGSATYHLPESAIPLLPAGTERELGEEWDGYTAEDVLARLTSIHRVPAYSGQDCDPSHKMVDAGASIGGQCCMKCSAFRGTRKSHLPCTSSLLTGARAQ